MFPWRGWFCLRRCVSGRGSKVKDRAFMGAEDPPSKIEGGAPAGCLGAIARIGIVGWPAEIVKAAALRSSGYTRPPHSKIICRIGLGRRRPGLGAFYGR